MIRYTRSIALFGIWEQTVVTYMTSVGILGIQDQIIGTDWGPYGPGTGPAFHIFV